MRRLPDIEKYCVNCGKRMLRERELDGDLESTFHFKKRKFCDVPCCKQYQKGKNLKEVVGPQQGRYRARQLGTKTPCVRCGSTRNVDRHHKDENTLNNDRSNLEDLCRGCHMKHHGILQLALQARGCTLSLPTEDEPTDRGAAVTVKQ